jgi:hypothetical protein
VILVPPSAPEFAVLLADIQSASKTPVAGSLPAPPPWSDPDAPAIILRNNSQTGIAALAWIWKTHTPHGRTIPSSVSMIGSGPSVLAPFGLDKRVHKSMLTGTSWLLGSKRLIRGNELLGDNTDVRPPQNDEIWKGGLSAAAEEAVCGRAAPSSPSPSLSTASSFSTAVLPAGYASQLRPVHLRSECPHGSGKDRARRTHLAPDANFEKIETLTGPDRGLAPPTPPPMQGPVDPSLSAVATCKSGRPDRHDAAASKRRPAPSTP